MFAPSAKRFRTHYARLTPSDFDVRRVERDVPNLQNDRQIVP